MVDHHPAAEIFPLLEGEQYTAFKADIETNGLRFPITLYEGQVLDGRNRLRACLDIGIEPKFVSPKIDDPVAFVCPSLRVPGTQVNCQFWGRDTLANGALLSDGLEYFVGH